MIPLNISYERMSVNKVMSLREREVKREEGECVCVDVLRDKEETMEEEIIRDYLE